MDQRLEELRRRVLAGEHKAFRRELGVDCQSGMEGLSWARRMALALGRVCEAERPTILPDERIVFTRTVERAPWPPPPEGVGAIGPGVGNICADWELSLADGLLGRRAAALAAQRRFAADPAAVDFLDAAVESIDAVLGLAGRYAESACAAGRGDLAAMLGRVPGGRPEGFHDALQSLRFMHAALWLGCTSHVGLGRLDQYLWPYLKADLDAGRLSLGGAEELLAEFFISLNKDTDLNSAVQRGDNGQSLMLGGVRRDGSDGVNPLTWMALRVSEQVGMIDPKLNLRVSSDTPPGLLLEAAKLTRKGLGFPQYANDEVVIPALAARGYALEDARDYSVAACWEFVVPGRGMDVPNISSISFPLAADQAIRGGLAAGDSFEGLLGRAKTEIRGQVESIVGQARGWKRWPPNPFYSALMAGCLEKGKDLNDGGAEYVNYGIHGTGAANAADALAAVKTLVFDRKALDGATLVKALDADFAGFEPLRRTLREQCPKTGNDEELPDSLLGRLFDYFADACEAVGDNGRGGGVRPGTGSAMNYIRLAAGDGPLAVGATADGRKKGEYFGCSLSPSPGAPVAGPLSVLQSFSRIDYRRVCNGGPITMELSDTVFRNEEALGKVADLVRLFVARGCQQLQLNTVNPAMLRDARLHPEAHRDLIVRVWGWSGYFCELAPEYQEHIIARAALAV